MFLSFASGHWWFKLEDPNLAFAETVQQQVPLSWIKKMSTFILRPKN